MKEQSAFDILLDYPKENGLVFETHISQEKFYLFPNDPFLRSKYVIFKKDDLIYFAYDSYAAKAYMTKTYTGIYSLISNEEEFECKVYKKDWLDLFIKRDRIRTGIKYIDDNLTITSNSKEIANGLINESVASLFLKLSEKIYPLELLIQNDYLPNLKELAGKKVVGIETNRWIFKQEEIDIFLGIGGEIIKNIKTPAANKRYKL
jgi:hypothetical protein